MFLLVIPSYLAVTSDGLPILGINLQITMIIIALVLFANILVLRVYFMEGTPPTWTGKLCDFCSVKKSKRVKRIHVSQHDGAHTAIAKSTATMTSIEITEASRGALFWLKELMIRNSLGDRCQLKWIKYFFVIFFIVSFIAYAVTFAT